MTRSRAQRPFAAVLTCVRRPVLTAALTAVLAIAATVWAAADPAAGASPAPSVSSVHVSTDRTSGKARVVVTGAGFVGVTRVLFGTTAGTRVWVTNSRRLTVLVPAHAAGFVDLRVVTRSGTSRVVAADRFHFISPPTVSQVAPASGSTLGGRRVILHGANYYAVKSVLFGTRAGAAVRVSAPRTSIGVTEPRGVAGRVDVRVVTGYGISTVVSADRFTFVVPPVITTIDLPDGGVGAPYSTHLTTVDHRVGGWTITAGALPAGLALVGYTVEGTPTTPGTSHFSLRFADTTGQIATAAATLVVSASRTFTATAAPLPAGATGFAGAESLATACPAADACVGVSAYVDGSGNQQALIETLAAGVWTAARAPLPVNAAVTNSAATLRSVACGAVGSCAAAGYYTGAGAAQNALLETSSGGAWTAVEAPLPAGAASSPHASVTQTTCGVAGPCAAIGSYLDASGALRGLLETLSNGVWTPVTAPLPVGGAGPALRSVTCGAPGGPCVAVGQYTDANGAQQGLLETSSGSAWTVTTAPLPVGAPTGRGVDLRSVSCAVDGSCAAVGDYDTSAQRALVETSSGGVWTPTTAPLPAGAASNSFPTLVSVSCAAAGSCAAVGYYYDTQYTEQGLLVRSTGGVWTATAAPLPNDTATNSGPDLRSVSCGAAGSCVAVGGYLRNNVSQGLIESLSNGVWTAGEAALPAGVSGSAYSYLRSVACVGPASCAAVGSVGVPLTSVSGLLETVG